jgi:hypothetical protein
VSAALPSLLLPRSGVCMPSEEGFFSFSGMTMIVRKSFDFLLLLRSV